MDTMTSLGRSNRQSRALVKKVSGGMALLREGVLPVAAKEARRLLPLLVVAGSLLQARDVTGEVTGPDDLPIPGAIVEIVGGRGSAMSDHRGQYRLANVNDNALTLRASADGFNSVDVDVPPSAAEVPIRLTELRSSSTSIQVVAAATDLRTAIPGSLQILTKQELVATKPVDANEVLRRVPGLTVREDSGPMAMRLNVGIRGLNPNRSRKVLMLEDGVPIALAPYGEPDMYYSPPIERMSRIEVLKGSGQIAHGPQTVGGVINFVTPDPPSRLHGEFDFEAGQRGLFVGQGSIGSSHREDSIGWIVNYLHKQGDGWREFFFDIEDVQVKLNLRRGDRHSLAIKAGLYDENSNSTYLGLTTPMFLRDPGQNPVPSDALDVERRSGMVSHAFTVSPKAVVSSQAFLYTTKRFWGRQDFDRADRGRRYLSVEGDPSMSGGAIYLRDSAGNRNRSFNVFGAQSALGLEHGLGQLDIGARYLYERAHDRRVNGDTFDARAGRIRDDEFRYGRALAGYAQNRFRLGSRATLTPGLRFVHYNQGRHITRKAIRGVPTNVDIRKDNGVVAVIPGLGFSLRASGDVTVFTGVHRGFAPPGTKVAITSDGENLDLDAELSWNYEAGVRVGGGRALSGELTFFRMDFSNQIITAAESGGATTTLTNGGATLHQGFESTFQVRWDQVFGLGPWRVHSRIQHMYLPEARFTENNLYGGNRLPYAPEQTVSVLTGLSRYGGLNLQFEVSASGSQFADNWQTMAASVDGTLGLIPAYRIANLTAGYELRRERWVLEPYFTVKNAFNAIYIASRAPQGIQPGMFRQANGGLRIRF